MVVKEQYALQPGGPERLVVSWEKGWQNFTIYLDGRELGKFVNPQAIKDGQCFDLKDGTQIKVKLIRDFIFWYLQILWRDRPVPGSETDPETQLRKAYNIFAIICKIGGACVGLVFLLSLLAISEAGAGVILLPVFLLLPISPYFLIAYFLKRKAKLAAYFAIWLFFFLYIYTWLIFWSSVLMSIFLVLASLMDGFFSFVAMTISVVIFNRVSRFLLHLFYAGFKRVWAAPIAIYQLDPKTLLNSEFYPNYQYQDNVNNPIPIQSNSAILTNLSNLTNRPPAPPPAPPTPKPPKPPKPMTPPIPRRANNAAIAKMQTLHPEGYKVYQQAEQSQDPNIFFQAGEMYDRSYSSFWGDGIFSGKYDRHFIRMLGISIDVVGMETAKQEATTIIKNSRDSLVISCLCYRKAIKLDSSHYWATLKLATALTAALQIEASLTYWRQALNLNQRDTLSALTADSMGFDNRSTAAKEVMYKLGLGSNPQQFDSNFIKQQAIAKKLLCDNPYLSDNIPKLRTG